MRIGVIAEGHADIAVIKAILKTLINIDGSDIYPIRPKEQYDETDLNELNFSNWNLVLKSCNDNNLLQSFFDIIAEEAVLIIQIDTAERGEKGYDIPTPLRSKNTDWKQYSEIVRTAVKNKIASILPTKYHEKVIYAIAIEETDAWLIPLFDNSVIEDTAQYANPKERLHKIIGKIDKKKKYINTHKKDLDYIIIGKDFRKGLEKCRKSNKSLDTFCSEVENKISGI